MNKPSAKKRIYVSVSEEVEKALNTISSRDKKPVASTASELLQMAIEIEEDAIWDNIAAERKATNNRLYSHDEAWA